MENQNKEKTTFSLSDNSIDSMQIMLKFSFIKTTPPFSSEHYTKELTEICNTFTSSIEALGFITKETPINK